MASAELEGRDDFATISQVDEIQKEIEATTPFVGDNVDLASLKSTYREDDHVYQGKLDSLLKTYRRIRQMRPDGNCFFRAFSFGYLEYLIPREEELKVFQALLQQRKEEVLAAGFPESTTSDFFDVLDGALENIKKGTTCTPDDLRTSFSEDGTSDFIVVAMRVLVSAELQKNSEFYMNFLQGHASVKAFCAQEVEPMYRESDHLHITGLTSSLGIPVRVVYMDRGGDSEVNHHDFLEEKGEPVVTLLYRPGHYDILYSSS